MTLLTDFAMGNAFHWGTRRCFQAVHSCRNWIQGLNTTRIEEKTKRFLRVKKLLEFQQFIPVEELVRGAEARKLLIHVLDRLALVFGDEVVQLMGNERRSIPISVMFEIAD